MDQEIEEKLVKNATALIEEFEKRYIIAIRSDEGWVFKERLDDNDLVSLACMSLNLIDVRAELEKSEEL